MMGNHSSACPPLPNTCELALHYIARKHSRATQPVPFHDLFLPLHFFLFLFLSLNANPRASLPQSNRPVQSISSTNPQFRQIQPLSNTLPPRHMQPCMTCSPFRRPLATEQFEHLHFYSALHGHENLIWGLVIIPIALSVLIDLIV